MRSIADWRTRPAKVRGGDQPLPYGGAPVPGMQKQVVSRIAWGTPAASAAACPPNMSVEFTTTSGRRRAISAETSRA
jgi:hypothetical protein